MSLDLYELHDYYCNGCDGIIRFDYIVTTRDRESENEGICTNDTEQLICCIHLITPEDVENDENYDLTESIYVVHVGAFTSTYNPHNYVSFTNDNWEEWSLESYDSEAEAVEAATNYLESFIDNYDITEYRCEFSSTDAKYADVLKTK